MSIVYEPGNLIYAKSTDALDDIGYALKKNADGTVSKASYGDVVIGFNFITTLNPLTNTYETNRQVSIIPRASGYVVKVKKVTGDGTAISKGSFVKLSSTAGLVEKAGSPPTVDTSTGDASALVTWMQSIIGIALEDASDSDDKVTVLLI